MIMTPKITVLMPVYNCELYVQIAVESILNQTYTDFEFLIIDDASTDSTLSILKSFSDSRIQIIEKPVNSGYTNSLNYGLSIAKGKYIARMDGDDISFSQRFAKQIAFLENNPDVVVCGTTYKIVGNDKLITLPENHEEIKMKLLWGNCIAHPSVMMRRESLVTNAIQYDLTREPAEDYDMWICLLAIGKLHNLQEVLLEYRVYNNQVSRKRAEDQLNSDIQSKFKLLGYLEINWTKDENQFLKKYFSRTEKIEFKNFKVFRQIQLKLSEANAKTTFFEVSIFNQFLKDFEADVLRKCFLKQKRYSPNMYFEYLRTKWKWGARVSKQNELKLGVKCFVFWKTQRKRK